jgi:biotin carboxyl carrier protein
VPCSAAGTVSGVEPALPPVLCCTVLCCTVLCCTVLQGDQVKKGQILGAIEQLGTVVDVKVSSPLQAAGCV